MPDYYGLCGKIMKCSELQKKITFLTLSLEKKRQMVEEGKGNNL